MIQVAQTISFSPITTTSEDSISTVFARHIVNGIEHATKNRELVETVLRIQKGVHAVCCQCGEKWPVVFISRSYARRLCNLARGITFDELEQELEQRLKEHVPQCSRCVSAGDNASRGTVN